MSNSPSFFSILKLAPSKPSSGEPAVIISPTIGKLVISVFRVYAGIIVPVVKKKSLSNPTTVSKLKPNSLPFIRLSTNLNLSLEY